jgi:predicted ester cyclase
MLICWGTCGSDKENAMPEQDSPDQVVPGASTRQDALLTEYNEVCSNFRTLTDIRFKLLAFLPIAAGVAVAVSKKSPYTLGLALPLFGLVATIGLATYNARNNQLYNELVDRAAAIERSLHIPDGAFANRPTPWLRITLLGRNWKIDHGTAISTIYAASIALWLFGIVAYVLEWCRRAYLAIGLPSISVKEPSAWVNTISIVVAIVATYLVVRALSSQREIRQKNMRVMDALKRFLRLLGREQVSAEENKVLVRREQKELWNHTGDLDAAEELFAADQAEAAKQEAADFRQGFPDVVSTIEDIIAEGDKVVAHWRSRATHQGNYMGIPPTGNRVEFTGISVYRIEGDKIAES